MTKRSTAILALVVIGLLKIVFVHAACPPQIGDKAPRFQADSTQGVINFPGDYKGKWVVFFSHPADFTPVCETEFKKFANMIPEFKKLNTELVGISVDEKYVHHVWIESLEKNGSHRINFPVIADLSRKISRKYGMIHPAESKTQTIRAVYFIDPKGLIRAIFYYPKRNGRSFEEIKRLLMALQTTDKEGVLTPADWYPGKKTLLEPKKKVQ